MSKIKNAAKVNASEDEDRVSSAIIGTYEGECADANITNLNGLDITREVWENVFSSDIYKKALEHGWYIGYLGHPQDDPDCQDFRKACIVMTEGHIDENGKVYGKFNLVDTPVGRIVKAFQDAGVIFGISVRGAGDIIQNSVDPETFIFRGFDLVTFPAFPESIPKFTAVAASTDQEQQKKYQAVCAAVKDNISALDTVQSVEIVQSCFAKQSPEYKALEDQKAKIQSCTDTSAAVTSVPAELDTVQAEILPELTSIEEDPRVESMTMLYVYLKEAYDKLREEYDTLSLAHSGLQEMYDNLVRENANKINSIERICTSQINDLNKVLSKVEGSLHVKTAQVKDLQKKLTIQASTSTEVESLKGQLQQVQASLDFHKEANRSLRHDIRSLSRELSNQREENLKYNEKVEAAQATIESKESIISSLKGQLDETVRKQAQENASANRVDEMESMKSKVLAAESRLRDFQNAYANLYAKAIGVRLPNLRVTASTDVAGLQKMIRATTSIPMKPDILAPTQDVDPSYFEVVNSDDDNDLVTL